MGGHQPDRPSTLVGLLELRAAEFPHRMAFRFGTAAEATSQLTYGQLYDQARRVAHELQYRGLVGQRALLLYPAGLDFIVAFFGCLLAGVVAGAAVTRSGRGGR